MKQTLAIVALAVTLPVCDLAHADITSNLVAEYSFDQCNGADDTFRGHDATLVGTRTTCVLSKKGDLAYQFSGSNYFQAASAADFNVAKAVTYSAWVKIDSYSGGHVFRQLYRSFLGFDSKSVTVGTDGRAAISLYNCMSGIPLTSRTVIPLGTWTHIAATYDGTFVKLYTNGIIDGAVIATAACDVDDTSTQPYTIGSGAYKGAIDDLRVYQRALSAKDVKALYGATAKPVIAGTAPWGTSHTVTCKDVTTGAQATIAATTSADWDCKKAGLDMNSGDTVQVIIDGTQK